MKQTRHARTRALASSVLLAAAAAFAAATAAAATYVVPWYANPTATTVADAATQAAALQAQATADASANAARLAAVNAANGTSYAGTLRTSHSSYFRPRLYILRQDGTLVILRLKEDFATIDWTTTLTSAELAAAAGGSGTVTDIEVEDDGKTAFLEFDHSGTYLALRHTAPSWRYYAAGEEGNPSPGSVNCITDGKWILKCLAADGWQFYIGTWTSSEKAILNDTMPECLDLSAGKATTATGTKSFRNLIFSLQNASGDGPRILLYPVTTEWPNSEGMKNARTEELIVAHPSLASASDNCTARYKRLVVDLPATTSVGSYYLGPDASGAADEKGRQTDFADFNLPVLKTVGQYAFRRCHGHGVLTLPSVATIAQNAFFACDYMEEAILAAEKKTLTSIATKAFSAEGEQGGCLKRVTLGCAEGFTMAATDAFAKQPLEVVTLTGAVPSFTAATAWPDTAADTMVFAIPKEDAAWEAVVAAATPLTDAQRKACHAAHPDWPIPFAEVAPSAFATHHAQYLAYAGDDTGVTLTVERDSFFDDSVAVSADWAPFADGTYPRGTTVTLAATPGATGTFVKWYGDIDRGEEGNPSVSLTLDKDAWVYARFVHPWTVSEAGDTAYNGNFTIRVSTVDAAARTLQIGADNVEGGILAASSTGTGILDLGGPFLREGDPEPWRAVQLSNGPKAWSIANAADRGIEGLLSPGTLLRCSTGNWNQSLNGSTYRLVILDEPDATWWMRDWWLTNPTCEILILRLPHLATMGYNYMLWTKSVGKTSFRWWNLDGVTSIHNEALAWSSTATERHLLCSGHLSLPSMRNVRAKELSRLPNLEGLTLGGYDKGTTVTNIAANAFAGDTSLRRLVLHADAGIVVGETPFAGGRTPDEIVFTGAPPSDRAVFANLFAGVSASDAPCVVRIPKGTGAWLSAPYIDANPTAAEKALAGDEAGRVFGVYRGTDGGTSFAKAICIMDEHVSATTVIIR